MGERANDKKTLRNIVIFSLVVLSCGWIGRLVDMKAGTDDNGSLGMLIWIVSPLLTMVILRTFMGDGWKDFGIKPSLKGNSFAYMASILFFPILAAIMIVIGHQLKWLDAANLSSSFLAAFGMALIPSFIKNMFEEFAWRGYLAPRLYSMGSNRLFFHSLVGLVWGAWHIPYTFTIMHTTESLITFIPRMLIGVVALSVVLGEIWIMTRSVWPALIMHTIGNSVLDTLFLGNYLVVPGAYEYLVMPTSGVIPIAFTALAGLWLYRRNSKPNTPSRSA
ncbi:CPBP family intramembrane glutamic endopeptidase [Paenibacillus harenae]|uniref:Membrane protease YdiL (CAAX protease family) n=1 Tax=Paenibacillus harenae TaxID=306543 RepID=A0ABT9U7I2_PAEHA|nr:CPBP family intramembrane glutamic endopeptidase [Paenibacillus harenae]MDQ0114968.1 membrane protease YdiL (CAAX protease family) [Paenibacillus harenae]